MDVDRREIGRGRHRALHPVNVFGEAATALGRVHKNERICAEHTIHLNRWMTSAGEAGKPAECRATVRLGRRSAATSRRTPTKSAPAAGGIGPGQNNAALNPGPGGGPGRPRASTMTQFRIFKVDHQ